MAQGIKNAPAKFTATAAVLIDASAIATHKFTLLVYPMYKPESLSGGRGWLLTLLLRSKPFRDATMALCTHHRRMTIYANSSHSSQAVPLIQQEKFVESCLESLNQLAQNSCPKSGLGIMSSIVQLLYFELFTRHGSALQAHFHAVISMCLRGYEERLIPFGLNDRSRSILLENISVGPSEPATNIETVASFRFLLGTLTWLDIIHSITTCTAPHLIFYHSSVLATNSLPNLKHIMGCENWVMEQLGRIAVSDAHKFNMSGRPGCSEFTQIRDTIEEELRNDKLNGVHKALQLSMVITRFFAYMALVYFHLVVYGYQDLEMLTAVTPEAVKLLHAPTSGSLLPALACPLYIIGTVARPEERPFFRNIFSFSMLMDLALKHRDRMLPALEDLWRRIEATPAVSWQQSADPIDDILLV